jgi:hypothetical protein
MLTPEHKELVQIVTPIVSATVASIAVIVAVWLSILQRRIQDGQRKIQQGQHEIQKAQLKNSLYDRRFEVYHDRGEFLARIARKNGALDSTDLHWYAPIVEKGDLLFGPEVAAYLKELQEKGGGVYVKSGEAKHKDVMQPFSGTDDHLAVNKMMLDFCGPMRERREALFRPYLKLEG